MTGIISLAENEIDVDETAGSVRVSFSRSGNTSGAVVIDYEIIGDTATAGVDFTGSLGTVTIPAGATRASINVPIVNDALSEATESLVVSILSVSSGTLSAPRTTRVNILDDENPVVIDPEPPLTSDYTVTHVPVVTDAARPIAAEFMPGSDNLLYVADQIGRIWVHDIDTGVRTRFMNLSSEVSFGQGLQSMALHPNFAENPYIYLYYQVDPPDTAGKTGYAGPDGDGNRFQWLVRVEADESQGYMRVVPGSRTVLVGGAANSLDDISGGGAVNFSEGPAYRDLPASDQINLSAAEIAAGLEYRQNIIKGDGNHVGGGIAFGPDGMLYLAIGDNGAFNYGDPRNFSVQDVNALNGKVLRIDPITGRGLADNPFREPGDSLDLNRSKVFQYGLRNPFNIYFADDGRLVISDTGHSNYEELDIGAPGANFGWPFYEGADGGELFIPPNFRPTAENGFQDEWDEFLAGNPDVTTAFRAFSHAERDPGYQFQAILGSSVQFDAGIYPDSLEGRYLFMDYSDGEIFTIDLDNRQDVQFLDKVDGITPVRYFEGGDGRVWYVDLLGNEVGYIEIEERTPDEQTIGAAFVAENATNVAIDVSYGSGVSLDNPVLFTSVSQNGPDPVSVEFISIDATGARFFLEKPDYLGGNAQAEARVGLVALEEGSWTVGDGRQLEVGTVAVPGPGFTSVTFDRPFDGAPIVLTQIQTDNGDTSWAVVRARNVTETGFQVRVQEEEANDSQHALTIVGYLALERESAANDVFEWNDLTTQAFSTGNEVISRWRPFDLSDEVGNDPIVAASLTTYNGRDPANLRVDMSDDGVFRLRAQEEQSFDLEVAHKNETANGLAFSESGALTGIELFA